MISYYKEIKDKNGYIYSIDKIVIDYFLRVSNMEMVAEELIDIRKRNNCDGWEKLNIGACSKYGFYQNAVQLGKIFICFGKYVSYDKDNKKWIILPMLRIEVNPNKHYREPIFQELLNWIKCNCTSGVIKKYDLAIDVPYPIGKIQVLDSRKEPGLFKGTIYRGQRQQHGFMKIYDKSKEQQLDYPITRIEHTLVPGKPLSLEKIGIIDTNQVSTDTQQLDNLNDCLVSLCLLVKACGKDYEPYIAKLNYRRKRTLQPYLQGNVIELEYDKEIIEQLLNEMNALFDADSTSSGNKDKDIFHEDENGFIQVDEEIELPFE